MKFFIIVLALILDIPLAFAQNFPQVMPPNTVYGRSAIGPGPGQAIPFAQLTSLMLSTPNTWTQPQSILPNVTTPITADGSDLLIQHSSVRQSDIYNPQVPAGWFNFDGVRSVVSIPAGSTQVNGNGFGAYVLNNNVRGGTSQSGVGYWGTVVCAVSNSSCWGENPTLNDQLSVATTGVNLIGSEIDFGVHSATTTVIGISLNGTATVQPNSIGFACASLSAQAPGLARWGTCFVSGDNTSQNGAYFGTLGPVAANTVSQPIKFGIVDVSTVQHQVSLDAAPAGTASLMRMTDSLLANGIAFQLAAPGNPVEIFAFGTDTNVSLALAGKGTGTVQLPLVTTGTPVASLCLDAANNIVKKTTTGPCI